MKLKVLFCLIVVMIISSSTMADNEYPIIDVIANDQVLNTFDSEQGFNTPAIIFNNRTMLPLKITMDLFGIEDEQINWNGQERSVTIFTNDRQTLKMFIDKDYVIWNNKEMKIDTYPIILYNRTYVPLSIITSVLGEPIQWDGEKRQVSLNPETYKINPYDLEFRLDRGFGYNKAVRVSSDYGYLLSNFKSEESKYIRVFKHDLFTQEKIQELALSYGVTSEEFTVNTSDILYYIYKRNTLDYIVFVKYMDALFEMEIKGLESNDINQMIMSFEEVK